MTSSIQSLEEKIAAAKKSADATPAPTYTAPVPDEGQTGLWIWAIALFAAIILYFNVFAPASDALPSYDVSAVCQAQDGSVSACVQGERVAYDNLRAIWDAQPSENRIWCVKALRPRVGDAPAGYAALALCVDQAAHGTRQAAL